MSTIKITGNFLVNAKYEKGKAFFTVMESMTEFVPNWEKIRRHFQQCEYKYAWGVHHEIEVPVRARSAIPMDMLPLRRDFDGDSLSEGWIEMDAQSGEIKVALVTGLMGYWSPSGRCHAG